MDIVTSLCYKSSCKAYLRKKLQERVKGYIHLAENGSHMEIEIFQDDHIIFKYPIYGLTTYMSDMRLSRADLDEIAELVFSQYRQKIFSKYFKF